MDYEFQKAQWKGFRSWEWMEESFNIWNVQSLLLVIEMWNGKWGDWGYREEEHDTNLKHLAKVDSVVSSQ